jgi:hypothetical protein
VSSSSFRRHSHARGPSGSSAVCSECRNAHRRDGQAANHGEFTAAKRGRMIQANSLRTVDVPVLAQRIGYDLLIIATSSIPTHRPNVTPGTVQARSFLAGAGNGRVEPRTILAYHQSASNLDS